MYRDMIEGTITDIIFNMGVQDWMYKVNAGDAVTITAFKDELRLIQITKQPPKHGWVDYRGATDHDINARQLFRRTK